MKHYRMKLKEELKAYRLNSQYPKRIESW